MRALSVSAVVLVTALAMTACSQAQSKGDAAFVEKATIAGLFEVDSSRLALDRATKPQLKEFAQMMVDDHTKANDALKTLIESGQVAGAKSVPTQLDGTHEAKLAVLKAENNPSGFETKYQQAQLDGHKQAVDLFTEEAASGQDPALKKWAGDTLPTIKDHLARIQALANTANR